MPNNTHKYELLCAIVNHSHGTKALKIAKQNGVRGGTIFFGRGTVKNRLLELLDLHDVRKEIVLMITEKAVARPAMHALADAMQFRKPHHGIVFSHPLKNFVGSRHHEFEEPNDRKAVYKTMYNAIYVIVDRGLAEEVVDAATDAGARGATVINARGSSVHETSTIFAAAVEPEKEIVLILVSSDIAKAVIQAIRDKMNMDESGNGILFTTCVKEALGLY